jgi:hypothetical protein
VSKKRRKRQPQPVCPPATQSHIGATKQAEVRTFSGSPAHFSALFIALIFYSFYQTFYENEGYKYNM